MIESGFRQETTSKCLGPLGPWGLVAWRLLIPAADSPLVSAGAMIFLHCSVVSVSAGSGYSNAFQRVEVSNRSMIKM